MTYRDGGREQGEEASLNAVNGEEVRNSDEERGALEGNWKGY